MQIMSNAVVVMRDVMKMCFVGFSIQIELAGVAGSVALFTHSQVVQLSVMTDFVEEECKNKEL